MIVGNQGPYLAPMPTIMVSSGALRGAGCMGTARVAAMQKWEYATVPLLVHATKQILDNWGDDGWELVALVPGPNAEQLVAYMKRPKEGA